MVSDQNPASDQDPVKPESDGSDQVDPKMLDLLVCPLTKGPLTFDRDKKELVSARARLAYPIRGGVPILLPSEARHTDDPFSDEPKS